MDETLYKRNASGKPIFWRIEKGNNDIKVEYGLAGKEGHIEHITTHRKIEDEINSLIKAKRKEGYKSLQDLYDNSPESICQSNLLHLLDTYLPKFNTHDNGAFIPMLCKTLENNKPFEKDEYFGQWKINGERCIITAELTQDLFSDIRLRYRSREGVDWTNKLSYLSDIILPCLSNEIIEMMIEEGVGLDGELYLPGYGINEINSFIKNTELHQHYQLQFWCYDLCIENVKAIDRKDILIKNFYRFNTSFITSKDIHLNNKRQFVLLNNYVIADINHAIRARDAFIDLGFEGLVIRAAHAEYQFGGKRNNSMLKFKKVVDGLFKILDIVPEGKKRNNLGKFILSNDINNETFECSYNATHKEQEEILINRGKYIGKKALVEFRERSGQLQVPFHARVVKICD